MPSLRQLANLLAYVLLFAFFLFVPAGTLHWRAAWILLAVLFVARLASIVALSRTRRSLLDERARFPLQRGQSIADRILLPAYMAGFALLVGFCAWDCWHARLLPAPPPALRMAGLLLMITGWGVVHLALRANAFAVTVVRHQPDRGQHVVSTGPYGIVRHPMYSGLVLVMLGIALWLGSTAGVLVALLPITLLAVRIVFEERLLRRALPGYGDYARRVRWRLAPGFW